jgi:rRNA-processing protein FCF1
MKTILDTNFIISAIKNKIQLFESLEELPEVEEIVVPLEVLTELEKIMQSPDTTTEEKEAAKLAEFMIKKKNITIVPLGTSDVDAGLVRYCVQNPCIIATLDRALKENIRQKSPNSQFLTIKEKNRIAFQ